MRTALIFGVTGQDGSYLADYLLSKNYKVYGAVRRVANRNLVVKEPYEVVDADITDSTSVARLIKSLKPDEIYNLAAQSHVAVSFNEPGHTWDATAKGCLNILEAIRTEHPMARFFQASSSEMFGGNYSQRVHLTEEGAEVEIEKFQNELTPFAPKSPYAVAKAAAHHMTQVYRATYNIFAVSGIMFNHESERRGENFVTRKITKYVANLKKSLPVPMEQVFEHAQLHYYEDLFNKEQNRKKLKLGNLNVWRDWGYAPDFVKAMHLTLNTDRPDDYVIATGKTNSLTHFLKTAFDYIGEKWNDWVEIDESLCRTNEVVYCHGDYSKINKKLGWKPETTFEQLVIKMLEHDLRQK